MSTCQFSRGEESTYIVTLVSQGWHTQQGLPVLSQKHTHVYLLLAMSVCVGQRMLLMVNP